MIVILVLVGCHVQEISGCISCAMSVMLASIYMNEIRKFVCGILLVRGLV
jgi:hypothetical protein